MIQRLTKTAALATLLFATASAGMAQTNPNRLLVKTTSGMLKGYLVERIEDLSFAKVEGEVKANVEITAVGDNELTINVTRTEPCQAFRLTLCSANVANSYEPKPDYFISMIEQEGTDLYYQDFTNATLSGIELAPATNYSVVTVGYDQYGIACGISRVDFRTEDPVLEGTPKVETSVTDVQAFEYTCKFTPNDDAAGYAILSGEKGSCQSYCSMFGFDNFGDLVKSWGITIDPATPYEYTWSNMSPATDYEVFVQAWDANGNYTACDTIPVRTLSLGGSGASVVDIELGEYKIQDWMGEMLPSQFITFTPNDQTAAYRYAVCYAKGKDEIPGYDGHEQEVLDELCSEPPFPGMAYWFFYDPLTTDFQIDPNTECVAVAVGKNADNVWGEPTIVRFTTPAEAASAPVAPSASVMLPASSHRLPGRAYIQPAVKNRAGFMEKGMKPRRITLK